MHPVSRFGATLTETKLLRHHGRAFLWRFLHSWTQSSSRNGVWCPVFVQVGQRHRGCLVQIDVILPFQHLRGVAEPDKVAAEPVVVAIAACADNAAQVASLVAAVVVPDIRRPYAGEVDIVASALVADSDAHSLLAVEAAALAEPVCAAGGHRQDIHAAA